MLITINISAMRRTMRFTIALFTLLLFFANANAQQKDEQNEEYNEEVTIIAPYQPSISDAQKIEMFPSIEVETPEKKPVSYNIKPQKINVSFTPEELQAVRVKQERREAINANFIKAGFGNYQTPYAELFSTTGPSENYRLGFHAKHLSHSGDIKDYATPKNSHNKAEIFGEKYFKNSSLYGKVLYNRDMVHRYGFQPGDMLFQNYTYADDDLKRIFSSASANLRFENLDKDEEEFDYHLDLKAFRWWDNHESLENAVKLEMYGNKPVEWFEAINYQSFGIKGNFRFFNSGDSLEAINSVHITLKPFMELRDGYYYLKGGVNVASVATDNKDTELTIFPDVRARIHVVPEYLTLFGGLTGSKEAHNLRKLNRENPFLISDLIADPNRQNYLTTKMDTYGGIKGNITRGFDFRLKAAYREKQNYPLYLIDFTKDFNNQFTILYEDLAITEFSGGFNIEGGDHFKLDLSGHYYSYDTENADKPWHLPELEFRGSAEYKMNAPLPLTLSLSSTIMTGRYGKDRQNNAVLLEDIIDISAGAEYTHSESLTAFLKVNNITAQNQYKWNHYPTYGLNFLIGAGYSF